MNPIPAETPAPASDRSPSRPLEVSAALAASVEQLLVGFAAKAELDTALVVDHSGALVSGISTDEAEEIDVVSVLAAGASGAIRALARRLGEPGEIESFHHGSGQVVYLGGVGTRFLLVGVCRSGTAIGAIREEARQIRPSLSSLLATLDETREAAARRAAALAAAASAPPPPPSPPSPAPLAGSQGDGDASAESEKGAPEGASPPRVSRVQEVVSEITRAEPEPEPLPTEIIEYIGGDDPEIVVEPSSLPFEEMADSPFEIEDEEEADKLDVEEPVDSPGEEAAAETAPPIAAGLGGGSMERYVFELDEAEDTLSDREAELAFDPAEEEEFPPVAADPAPGGAPLEADGEPPGMPRSLFELADEGDGLDLDEPPALGATGLLGEEEFDFPGGAAFELAEKDPLPAVAGAIGGGEPDGSPGSAAAEAPEVDDAAQPAQPAQPAEPFDPGDFQEIEFEIDFEEDEEARRETPFEAGAPLAGRDIEAEALPEPEAEAPGLSDEPDDEPADDLEDEPAVAKGPLYF